MLFNETYRIMTAYGNDGALTFRPRTFRPRTFRPRKKPKVNVSAITINFGFGMCACINV